HGRRNIHRHHHLARVFLVEPERVHLADADAVEIHRRTGPQARHRAVEHDLVGAAAAALAGALEPPHEAEAAEHDGEREDTDQDVIGPRFHTLTLPRLLTSCA